MKKYLILLLVVVSATSTMFLTGCDSNEETAAEKQLKLLLTGKPWVIESVTVDNVDESDLFTDLELTFADGTLSTSNGVPVWEESDTWEFTDSQATAFTRGDGVEVTIDQLTKTKLVLTLTWDQTTIGGGRTESIEGEHTFTFGL